MARQLHEVCHHQLKVNFMDLKTLEKKIAYLEFVNDQLESEIMYVDQLLREAGFTDGLSTIKSVAREVIDEESLGE